MILILIMVGFAFFDSHIPQLFQNLQLVGRANTTYEK